MHKKRLEDNDASLYKLWSDIIKEGSHENDDCDLATTTKIFGRQVVKSRIPSESPLIEDVQFEEV